MSHFSRTCKPIAREQPLPSAPKPRSYATWVTDHAADALSSGNFAGLCIDVPRKRNDGSGLWDRFPTYYRVWAEDGCWHLSKEGELGIPAEHYVIDTSFGPKPEHWECKSLTHKDGCCPSREQPACKHRRGIHAALVAIGILPPRGNAHGCRECGVNPNLIAQGVVRDDSSRTRCPPPLPHPSLSRLVG